ncbi:EAL domain-containing protein [Reinekea forsetii]|nr:EAL domain-containing protein [Reinekea forsetii]
MPNKFRPLNAIPVVFVVSVIAIILAGFALKWSNFNDLLSRDHPEFIDLDYGFTRTTQSVNPEKLDALEFSQSKLNSIKPKYGDHTDWHKFTLTNKDTKSSSLVVKFDNPMIDNIDIYRFRSSTQTYVLEKQIGDLLKNIPVDERIASAYQFSLRPMESRTFIVASQTLGSPKLPIVIFTKDEFSDYQRIEFLIWGTFIGIAMLMAIYNLVLYQGVRDLTYLAYIGYVIAILVNLGVIHGYGYYLFKEPVQLFLNQHILPQNALLALMTIFFAVNFLKFNRSYTKMHRYYSILSACLAIYFVFSFFIPEYLTVPVFSVLQLSLYILAYKMVTFKIKERFSWSKYYVISWLPLFIGAGVGFALFTGNAPYNFWTRYAFLFSAIFEMTLISMALAERLGNTESQRLYQATHESKFGFANDGLLQKTINRLQEGIPKEPISLITVEITNYNVIAPYLTDKQLSVMIFGLANYIVSQLKSTLPVIELDEVNNKNGAIALARGDLLSILVNTDDYINIEDALKRLSDLENFNPVQGSIPYRIHCIFGAAIVDAKETNQFDLINQAKQAITQAKEKDVPYFIYSPESDLISERRIKLALDLANAIRNNELELYHQPQLFSNQTHITPSELLIRWKHPLYGFISPDEFVMIAEETGLINHLTTWVITRAAKHAKALVTFGIHDFHFAINVSAHDLSKDGFCHEICNIFKRHNLLTNQFTLELTETTHSLDSETFNKNLFDLSEAGFNLAIDDFGTGYSSLTYASDHPFDDIKIDKQFIQDFFNSEKHQAIVKATITMAKNLDLNVTAEGIEDGVTLELLKELGCDKLQGYYIAKPMPFNEYLKWRSPNFETHTKIGENLTLDFNEEPSSQRQ